MVWKQHAVGRSKGRECFWRVDGRVSAEGEPGTEREREKGERGEAAFTVPGMG